ncbi:hypothetical protein BGHDH14_bghG003027000003001 [Blumeria hordei DH14]|uniref:Uncharacterized protein n=1 Tax=Blumeria graminis f. sp. hordei (strain DH14) TaxID=546991 RepID=N1JFW9_BLUG1|nr:hypothetical protein BGHDH14_bghG003027000003001 [Blumeria hordei DH14]
MGLPGLWHKQAWREPCHRSTLLHSPPPPDPLTLRSIMEYLEAIVDSTHSPPHSRSQPSGHARSTSHYRTRSLSPLRPRPSQRSFWGLRKSTGNGASASSVFASPPIARSHLLHSAPSAQGLHSRNLASNHQWRPCYLVSQVWRASAPKYPAGAVPSSWEQWRLPPRPWKIACETWLVPKDGYGFGWPWGSGWYHWIGKVVQIEAVQIRIVRRIRDWAESVTRYWMTAALNGV